MVADRRPDLIARWMDVRLVPTARAAAAMLNVVMVSVLLLCGDKSIVGGGVLVRVHARLVARQMALYWTVRYGLSCITARNGSLSRGCAQRDSRFHDSGANLNFVGERVKKSVLRRIGTRVRRFRLTWAVPTKIFHDVPFVRDNNLPFLS